MFIGREKELETLNRLYKTDKFEFVVIYGRRRVGKTELINHFIDDKKAIYFMGVESNEKQNLENFSKSIIEFSSGIQAETSFSSFQTALNMHLNWQGMNELFWQLTNILMWRDHQKALRPHCRC